MYKYNYYRTNVIISIPKTTKIANISIKNHPNQPKINTNVHYLFVAAALFPL